LYRHESGDEMINAAIYVRLSDEDRNKRFRTDESESIQNQRSLLREYCLGRGWNIYDEYCDENYSGTDFERPEFRRMLGDCEKGAVNVVLCKSQSRFSRDLGVIEEYIHNRFIEWGVRFVSIVDHADTDDAYNKRTRQINGLNNEWYCEDTSLNVRRILRHKRENGQFTGSFAPYGYRIDPDDRHHLIIDSETAPVVKEIYLRYLSGQGYKKIVGELNSAGIPSPTEYKHMTDSRYVNRNADSSPDSGLWTLSTVASILRSEVYTGTLAQGRTHCVSYKNHHRLKVPEDEWIRTQNAHEAIVERDMWDAVRKMLESKTHRGSSVTGEIPALSGKVRCGVCGRPMSRNTYYNKDHTDRYYNLRCAAYRKGTDNCTNSAAVSGMELEAQIIAAVNDHIAEYCEPDTLAVSDGADGRLRAAENALGRLGAEIGKKRTFISAAYEDRLEGRISQEEYELHTAKFRADIEKIDLEKEKLLSRIEAIKKDRCSPENAEDKISRFCRIDKLDYITVNEFISSIHIGAKERDGTREIRIEWNF